MAQANRKTKNSPPKRGASKKKPAARKPAMPPWMWLFTGVVVGLFIALLFKLAPNAIDLKQAVANNNQPRQPTQEKSANSQQPTKAVFDFYTILTENETIVSDPTPVKPKPTPKPTVSQENNKPEKPVQSKPPANESYVLQAGSFRNKTDADRRRAQLILMGLSAQTQKVNIKNGETWFRVQVGPFKTKDKLGKAKTLLASNKIDSLAVRIR
ncbi:SPOR domain-containing protein [Endozoicomonas sp. SM1973]|uniref:SPOR domain-containing protein n=1 Tax=Spartinivicinus marinus TaxID=2994442 RepID=A0A853ICC6_9GAMM|nr:SPOR domain-containing protein [Spartinivicinus marinus]MCX4026483.1 SPOR domain-containing protein [Spartinivicinus marinus]NYZ66855.1 SPOR domain-containing protein [Spartinivicinus marinus]